MLNMLLRKARAEVESHGRILTDTAAKLMALGIMVEKLEYSLLHQVENI